MSSNESLPHLPTAQCLCSCPGHLDALFPSLQWSSPPLRPQPGTQALRGSPRTWSTHVGGGELTPGGGRRAGHPSGTQCPALR